MQHTDAEEYARARLAYVSAGRPALSAPRRALIVDEASPPTPDPPAQARPEPTATAQPARPRLSLKHLAVVAVLLLCGVGVAMSALSRSAATEVPVAPGVSAAPSEPSSPPPPVMVRVHVAGAVAAPGVVSIPEDAIVQDAIAAAGGLADGADPAQLNLAAPVGDGMQILIGTVEDPIGEVVGAEPSTSGGSTGGQVNLNKATQSELESLPGVGPVTAQAIIAWRDENGSFSSVAELQEISGIGPKTFQKLQPLVTT